ncbi:hypothetical protein ADUPG1_012025, partial [Aduncisulcus paluster]
MTIGKIAINFVFQPHKAICDSRVKRFPGRIHNILGSLTWMQFFGFLFVIAFVMPFCASLATNDDVVDANLRNDICLALDHAAYCKDLTEDDFQHLTSLNTYFVDSFAGLSAATNLTTLYVSNTDSVSKQLSTSDIEDLPTSLETLTLNNIDIAPNTDFSRLTSLRALYLTVGAVSSGDYWATQLSSLTPLFDSDNHYDVTVQGMFPSSLTTLSISGRTNVTFPGFFSSLALSDGSALPALTTLDLSGTSVYDLSPVPATVTSLNVTQALIDDLDDNEDILLYLSIHPRDLSSIPSTITELTLG